MTDPAKARFYAIGAVRIAGVALVLLGILILRGTVDLPAAVAYAFIVVGLADVFVMPILLARRWRSGSE